MIGVHRDTLSWCVGRELIEERMSVGEISKIQRPVHGRRHAHDDQGRPPSSVMIMADQDKFRFRPGRAASKSIKSKVGLNIVKAAAQRKPDVDGC